MELSDQQRRLVTYEQRRHLLVIAGPGSGKTRTITERIAYQIEQRTLDPEQALVMTFGNHAASTLRDRLHARIDAWASSVRIGTFHSICEGLLRSEGTAIGIKPSFVVLDPSMQRPMVERAIAQAGGTAQTWHNSAALREISDRISARKREQFRTNTRGAKRSDGKYIVEIQAQYDQFLREHNAFDFDDLIIQTIRLLHEDDEVATRIRRRFTHVYLDEYHDVSPEQYVLVSLLAPSTSEQQTVTILADPCQSIYGWRWANASQMLARFRRDYQPVSFELSRNYRSAGHIVRAAKAVIDVGRSDVRMEPHHAEGHLVYEKCSDDEGKEAAWIVAQIRRLTEHRLYTFNDIALLYRVHRRADIVERALLSAGIPVDRTEEGRFFADADVQGTLRYLALVAALHDDRFIPALNWPRVLVDELTMVRLQRTAEAAGLSLAQLAGEIDSWKQMVSPLTRAAIRDFLTTIGNRLLAVADQSITTIVECLLGILAERRQAWAEHDRQAMHGFLTVLGRPLRSAVDHLHRALEAERSVMLIHDGTVDAIAGCVLLGDVLERYLHQSPSIDTDTSTQATGAFIIRFGTAVEATTDGFGIALRDALTTSYSISTQAWRIGQMLLMRFEQARHDEYVVYDLETSGIQSTTAEILEVGAQRVRDGKPVAPPFTSLVKPQHPIPMSSTEIHGIRPSDVQHAPHPSEVIPALLHYFGDATLVGHNIASFDQQVLHRIAIEHAIAPPSNAIIDTCELARRLLPGQSHRLVDLAQRWGIHPECNHRAADDVSTNVAVFERLLDLLDAEKELDALAELLPLVAVGIAATGMPINGENAVLMEAGSRKRANNAAKAAFQCVAALLDDRALVEQAYRAVAAYPHGTWEEDQRWERLAQHWRAQLELYRATGLDQRLTSFLRYAALAQPLDHYPTADGRVTMMTIHNSKGLEWPVVFLVGAEDGLLPMRKKDAQDAEEERRLMYVGMTRAKDRLCITWVKHAQGWKKTCSQFLHDIPDEHLRTPRQPVDI